MESFTKCTVTLYISETLSLSFSLEHCTLLKSKTCKIKQTIPINFQRIRIYTQYMESLTNVLRVEVEVELSCKLNTLNLSR